MPKLTQLKADQKAPDFEMTDITGKKVVLSDYAHSKVLLCFFRYAGCPWCNLAIHQLIVDYPMFAGKNFEIIAFVQSQPENIEKYILDRHTPNPPFSIIADPDRVVYDMYGVSDSKPKSLMSIANAPAWLKASLQGFPQGKIDGSTWLVPAHFMISEEGVIFKADYGTKYYDALPMAEIIEFANSSSK